MIDKLDFWVHLGDYIYEYAQGNYPTQNVRLNSGGDDNEPWHEIVSLQDYRLRHAQYKTDDGAKNLHARAPLIAIWVSLLALEQVARA